MPEKVYSGKYDHFYEEKNVLEFSSVDKISR